MRLIGQLETQQLAERFAAFLTTKEISSQVEQENDLWEIWVRDEDQLDVATQMLADFAANPDAPAYRKAIEQAQVLAREEEKKRQQAHKNMMQMQNRWNAPLSKRAPLTIALVVICGIVSLATNFGSDRDGAAFRALALGSLTNEQAIELVGEDQLDPFNTRLRLGSILRGELWRLVTPIFIHIGPWHLLFNMYVLVIFGSQIEQRYGPLWMAILIVALAIPSNLANVLAPADMGGVAIAPLGEYWTVLLGGFSGVLYGFFGYIWMKMVFDPKSGLFVTPLITVLLLVQLVLYMTPGFSEATGVHIANWAHGVGFVLGLTIGYFPKMMSDLGFGNAD